MYSIESFRDLEAKAFPNLVEQLKYIFFVSSSIQTFSSELKKEEFFQRWCGNYIKFYPAEFYILFQNGKIYGYLSGCSQSFNSLELLKIPGHDLFLDQFDVYPAHLHINFHPDARNKGLGSLLVEDYCKRLKCDSVKGLHLITSPNSQNVSFYKRLNFDFEVMRLFNGNPQLFLGRTLIG